MNKEVYKGIFTGHNIASNGLNLVTISPHRTITSLSMKVKSTKT
jgi:hypothetical protein